MVVGEAVHRIRKVYAERNKEIEQVGEQTGVELETETVVVLDKEKEKEFEEKVSKLPEVEREQAFREQAADHTAIKETFAPGSNKVLPGPEMALRKIAKVYQKDGKRHVLVVGYSDDSGDVAINQNLSEQRALAVARIFVEQGFPPSQVLYQGAGESDPVDTNDAVAGRENNRRVEISEANTPGKIGRARVVIAESQKPEVAAEPPTPPTKPATHYGTISSIIAFNGKPYNGGISAEFSRKIAIAAPQSGGFFITEAQAASGANLPAFMDDDLPVASVVKRADGGEAALYDFDDYLPGYKGAIMYAHAARKILAVHPVSLLHERNVAVSAVTGAAYEKQSGEWSKQAEITGTSVAYPAANDESLAMYRWKASEAAVKRNGIFGADILVRRFSEEDFGKTHVLPGQAYYLNRGEVYTAEVDFSITLPVDINPEWRFFK